MNEFIIIIGIAALALGCYWAWRFYHKDDKPMNLGPDIFGTPSETPGGPAQNPDGSINWNSDEPLSGAALQDATDQLLAPYRSTPEEKSRYRCPHCGSSDWGSVPDIIFCGKGCGKGTSDPEYYQKCLDAGYDGITWLSEWMNPDYPWPEPEPESTPGKVETTFSLIAGLFKKQVTT